MTEESNKPKENIAPLTIEILDYTIIEPTFLKPYYTYKLMCKDNFDNLYEATFTRKSLNSEVFLTSLTINKVITIKKLKMPYNKVRLVNHMFNIPFMQTFQKLFEALDNEIHFSLKWIAPDNPNINI